MTPTATAPAGLPVQYSPDYHALADLFPTLPVGELVASPTADDVPEPYRSLLVHTHHMTVTVEQFYGGPVDVRVLDSVRDGDEYARSILLVHRESGRVVQSGVVRIDLSLLAPKVREEILAEDTPLGRVLIQNNVLRRVQPTGYLCVALSAELATAFGCDIGQEAYGRLGVIYTDGKPAIQVLEVLAPVLG